MTPIRSSSVAITYKPAMIFIDVTISMLYEFSKTEPRFWKFSFGRIPKKEEV